MIALEANCDDKLIKFLADENEDIWKYKIASKIKKLFQLIYY